MNHVNNTTAGRRNRPNGLGTVAIVGRGKVSNHIPYLFQGLFDFFKFIDRQNNYAAVELDRFDAVILAVQDDKIESSYHQLRMLMPKTTQFFHMSGARSFPKMIGLHPLMTFTENSRIENYERIPIFTDNQVFFEKHKTLINNLRYIPSDLKTKYHAMAVMLGNFSQYYLQQVKNHFPESLSFEDYRLLTLNSVENIFNINSKEMLTGPFVRNDLGTILKHKKELEKSEPILLRTYQSMQSMFEQELFRNEN